MERKSLTVSHFDYEQRIGTTIELTWGETAAKPAKV